MPSRSESPPSKLRHLLKNHKVSQRIPAYFLSHVQASHFQTLYTYFFLFLRSLIVFPPPVSVRAFKWR